MISFYNIIYLFHKERYNFSIQNCLAKKIYLKFIITAHDHTTFLWIIIFMYFICYFSLYNLLNSLPVSQHIVINKSHIKTTFVLLKKVFLSLLLVFCTLNNCIYVLTLIKGKQKSICIIFNFRVSIRFYCSTFMTLFLCASLTILIFRV